jgi:hypothetical protein
MDGNHRSGGRASQEKLVTSAAASEPVRRDLRGDEEARFALRDIGSASGIHGIIGVQRASSPDKPGAPRLQAVLRGPSVDERRLSANPHLYRHVVSDTRRSTGSWSWLAAPTGPGAKRKKVPETPAKIATLPQASLQCGPSPSPGGDGGGSTPDSACGRHSRARHAGFSDPFFRSSRRAGSRPAGGLR